jgi:hypothetical protein
MQTKYCVQQKWIHVHISKLNFSPEVFEYIGRENIWKRLKSMGILHFLIQLNLNKARWLPSINDIGW